MTRMLYAMRDGRAMLRQKFRITMFFELSTLYIPLPYPSLFPLSPETFLIRCRDVKNILRRHASSLRLVISLILGAQSQA